MLPEHQMYHFDPGQLLALAMNLLSNENHFRILWSVDSFYDYFWTCVSVWTEMAALHLPSIYFYHFVQSFFHLSADSNYSDPVRCNPPWIQSCYIWCFFKDCSSSEWFVMNPMMEQHFSHSKSEKCWPALQRDWRVLVIYWKQSGSGWRGCRLLLSDWKLEGNIEKFAVNAEE